MGSAGGGVGRGGVRVCQAYRFALDPAPAQERRLRSHAGAARFAWNWGLAQRILRAGHRPGRQRRSQPAQPRRQWGGEPKRLRRDGKTRPGWARPSETGTRHCPRRPARDRQRATAGCGTEAHSCSLNHNGHLGHEPRGRGNLPAAARRVRAA
ncbi:MAG: helix-turn-helix domain-containing protein [Streptosporangiaceae bacterium]